MNKKKIRIIMALIIAGALLIMVAGIFVYIKKPWKPENPDLSWPEALPMETVLSAEAVAIDREDAIKFIEDVHPYFVDGSDALLYQEAKEEYVAKTQSEMSVRDFMVATCMYYSFFEDGHTNVWWSESEYLDIDVKYEDGKYYLAIDSETAPKVYITSISDISITKINEAIDILCPAENEMANVCNYTKFFGAKGVLLLAGVDVNKETIPVKFSDGSTVETSFKTVEGGYASQEQNEIFLDGDVVVVDFNICENDKILDNICKELKQYIDEGYNKVIIDARSNPGGASSASVKLLETLGMRTPSYGVLVRYSEEAKAQRGYIQNAGFSYSCAPALDGKANEKINLAVLCDRDTYSSATMLLVYVRDGDLGAIIGEPSSNMPSCYGDILYNVLENSHIITTVSHKKFVRPDADNTEKMLVPDILTNADDAYGKAYDFLHQ